MANITFIWSMLHKKSCLLFEVSQVRHFKNQIISCLLFYQFGCLGPSTYPSINHQHMHISTHHYPPINTPIHAFMLTHTRPLPTYQCTHPSQTLPPIHAFMQTHTRPLPTYQCTHPSQTLPPIHAFMHTHTLPLPTCQHTHPSQTLPPIHAFMHTHPPTTHLSMHPSTGTPTYPPPFYTPTHPPTHPPMESVRVFAATAGGT